MKQRMGIIELDLAFVREQKDLMVVFDGRKFIGVMFPEELKKHAKRLDPDRNKAWFTDAALKRILISREYYYALFGYER
jgi:hypothetical protein